MLRPLSHELGGDQRAYCISSSYQASPHSSIPCLMNIIISILIILESIDCHLLSKLLHIILCCYGLTHGKITTLHGDTITRQNDGDFFLKREMKYSLPRLLYRGTDKW